MRSAANGRRRDQEFRKALAIDARGTRDHGAYGLYLLGRGDYRAARELAKRDEEEYPADITFLKRAALYFYALREFSEAERILEALFALEDRLWHAHHLRSLICLATDRPELALSHARKMIDLKDTSLWPGLHIVCLEKNGYREEARGRFSELLGAGTSGYVQPLQLALGYMALGDAPLALEWLGKGADAGDPHMLWLHLWPFLDPLRGHPEFLDLIQRLGLPQAP
jgi:tetratricopeptide (TPR) repeat protein